MVRLVGASNGSLAKLGYVLAEALRKDVKFEETLRLGSVYLYAKPC